MLHTDCLTWQSRLGVLVAVVCVLLGGLAHPVRADILVSDFCSLPISGGEVRRFTDAGDPNAFPVPFFTLGGDSLGAEGLACLNDTGVFRVFAANFGPVIHICELNTPGPCNQVFATSPHGSGTQYTALGLSLDGTLLYASDQTLGFIDAFNTSNGTLAFSIATLASHDIRVGPDGFVYATHVLHNTGVLKCTPNLSSCSQFIAPGDNGLLCPTGMTFDGAGNFWVANFGTTASQPTCESAVYKYSPTGVFLQRVANDPLVDNLLNPVGLETGPGGGNIFAAAFGNNVCNPTRGSDIARINTTTFAVNTHIPFPAAGLNPKYLFFTQHCIIRQTPPPGPPPLVLKDNEPGSLLICPIFDVIGANQTKMRITCSGPTGTRIRVTYVCQPLGSSTTSAFCASFDEAFDCTAHQTFVFDVGTQLAGSCPTGQGYVMAFAEDQCETTSPTFNPSTATCATATGGALGLGEFGPISFNQLFGSCHLYYNGSANPGSLLCGSVSCSPPATGPFPDVEAVNAIGIQSPHPAFSFLGNDTGGALQLSFGTTTAFDYVGLPRTVQTDFAAPGASLIAGPSTFTPFIPPDTISGTELQTNIILLNLNYSQFAANLPAAMSVNAWNWFENGFTSTHRFICWERIPINLIDPRITAAGPFGAPYGNIKFTPSPLGGSTSPHLLGAVEEVSTVGRTLRNLIHSSVAASPALFITDIE